MRDSKRSTASSTPSDSPVTVALIPAYNEAATIAATVEAVVQIPFVTEVLVINDGSSDATAQLAHQAGARVVHTEKNAGKGAALELGIASLTAPFPTVVLLLDGDLGTSSNEAEALLHPVYDGLADMTVGVLPKPPGSGGFGVVKDLARRSIRDWGGGYDAQAPLSGQRALTWECLQAVLPFARGYGVEVALTIRALQQGFRMLEVRVNMQHRATGRDLPGFLHRGRQYIDIRHTIRQLDKE